MKIENADSAWLRPCAGCLYANMRQAKLPLLRQSQQAKTSKVDKQRANTSFKQRSALPCAWQRQLEC